MSRLYVICGPAGVGKSTFGKELAAEKKGCFLDSDTVSEATVRAGLELASLDPDDRDSAIYKATFRDEVYESLYAVAHENLPRLPVVMVGPFTREIRDSGWKRFLEEKFAVPVEVIFVICPSEERQRRIRDRGNPRDASKLADWSAYLAQSDESPPAFSHQVVET